MSSSEGIVTPADSTEAGWTASQESLLASLLDELTQALRQGRQPDVEHAVANHPSLACDLRALWATVWVAEEMARKESSEPEPLATPNAGSGTIEWRESTG